MCIYIYIYIYRLMMLDIIRPQRIHPATTMPDGDLIRPKAKAGKISGILVPHNMEFPCK